MFAPLTRRWRIVAPAITGMVALVIVVAAMIVPASAASSHKTLHFRFSGDAADFVNFTTNPAFFDCFSGFLDPSGGSNIHAGIADCLDPGWANGVGLTRANGRVAVWDITSDHNSKEGHVVSEAQLAGGGDTVNVEFNPTGFNANNDPEDTVRLFEADHVTETAEAECQRGHNDGRANARAQADFNELVVMHDILTAHNPGADQGSNESDNSFDAVNAAASGAFGSLVITRGFDTDVAGGAAAHFTLILTTNDQRRWVSGDHAAISANALQVIVQDDNGNILADVAVGHVHANIECAFHKFHFEDPIGA